MHLFLGCGHLLFGLSIGEEGVLIVVGADESFLVEGLIALHVGVLVVELTLGACHVGLGGVELAQQVGLVEFGDDLALLHLAVVVDVEFVDNT